jgi:ribosome-binding protein aMBF1 (putative translation factor)
MKCDICGKTIANLFLSKFKGTYVNINKKRKTVCSECQSRTKNKIKDEL